MCGNMRYTCMLFNKYLHVSTLVKILWVYDFEIWHWPLHGVQIHMQAKYQVSISTGSKCMVKTLHLTHKNVRLHEIHMHANFIITTRSKIMANVKIDILTNIYDLWHWRMTFNLYNSPLQMCGFIRNICMPNIKSLFLLVQTRLRFLLSRSKCKVKVIWLHNFVVDFNSNTFLKWSYLSNTRTVPLSAHWLKAI